jgi:DivIVA protein
MSALFNSLGLSLAFAGGVILLAGLFLTPIGGVLVNALRSRLEVEVPLPPAPVQQAPGVQTVTVPWSTPATSEAPTGGPREQEALFARTLVTAQKTAEDLVAKAKAEAQVILEHAQTTANDIVGAARRNASETVQSAEQQAEVIVAAANEKAMARLAMLQAEVQRLVVDAHQVFQGAQRVVQQNIASVSSRLDQLAANPDAGSDRGHEARSLAAAESPASRADGADIAWQVQPSGDGRGAMAVGGDGAGATDRRTARFP